MSVKSNIWKIYAIQGLRGFMVAISVLVLFYQENGLSMTEVLVLQAAFSAVVVLGEVPSGYFADKFGRKKSIVLGCVCAFLGFLIYSFSYSFTGFLLAEIALGVSLCLMSGADSALLYDSLLEIGEAEKYKANEGKKIFFGSSSEGLAAILGGLIGAVSLRFPLYLEAAVLFLSIPVALSLVETKIKELPKDAEFTSMKQIVAFSLLQNKQIKWLIFYFATVYTSTLSVIWFIQPYLKDLGLSIAVIGVAWACFQFVNAIFSFYAHRIEKFLGLKTSLLILIPIACLGYIITGTQISLWGALGFVLFQFVRALNIPILLDNINRLVPSNIRATVLSIKGLMSRLAFTFIGPFIGWVHDIYSLQTAFIFAACLFAVLGFVCIYYLNRHKIITV